METQHFSEKESMAVIMEMISTARNSLQKGIADFIIFWGYLIALTAIAAFVTGFFHPEYMSWVWLSCVGGWVFSFVKGRKINLAAEFRTYTNIIFGRLWLGFGAACLVLVFCIFYASYRYQLSILFFTLTPTILLMQGICLFTSGFLYRFKPFIYAAAGSVICSILCYVLPHYQFVILAVCEITSLVIPGHLLNRKAEKNV
jgi:hypothetical protein